MLSTAKSSLTEPTFWFSGSSSDLVVRGVGNGAAGGQRGQPRADAGRAADVDRVVVDQRAATAAARGEAVRQHANDRAGNPPRSSHDTGSARRSSARQFLLVPVPRRDFGDDLLRQHVQRPDWDRQGVEFAATRRCRAAPRTRRVRRATAETAGPSACPPPRGRSGRRVAGSSRSSAASRAGRRGRRRRCRCRVPATRWRPALSARRASVAARRRAAVPWPCCRDAR